MVAEIYGPDYEEQRKLAEKVRRIFENTSGVVDVDWYVEGYQRQINIIVDKEKAALHGISSAVRPWLVPPVTCHLSPVTCHLSPIVCCPAGELRPLNSVDALNRARLERWAARQLAVARRR